MALNAKGGSAFPIQVVDAQQCFLPSLPILQLELRSEILHRNVYQHSSSSQSQIFSNSRET